MKGWKPILAMLLLVLLMLVFHDAGKAEGILVGRVEAVTDWTLQVKTAERDTYTFLTEDLDLDFLGLGDWVQVTYRGEQNLQGVIQALKVEKIPAARKEEKGAQVQSPLQE